MAVTNNLVSQVDLPVWEWTRFSPITNSALSTLCSVKDATKSRYMYQLTSGAFFRYDTKMDTWQLLQTPPVNPTVTSTIEYMDKYGYEGNVLSFQSSSSIEIPSLQGQVFNGYKLRIVNGAGSGYEGTITASTENIIWDQGIGQTTATSTTIGDSTKRWRINQWVGYSVRLVYGTGNSQIRKVLYNNETTLTFSDATYQQLDPANNTGFNVQIPYAAPVTTAGLQATFYIESTVVSLNTPFTVSPNASSSFIIESGGLMFFTSNTTAPWSNMQYYDVLSDAWATRTALGGLTTAAFATDFSIKRTSEASGYIYSATTVASASSRTIFVTGTTYTTGDLINKIVKIISGTGAGQKFRIVGNTTNIIEVAKPWSIQPDSTSVFEIWPNVAEFYLIGNSSAAMYKYNLDYDYWLQGPDIDYGPTINVSINHQGQEPLAVASGTRNTNGITSLAATPTAGGSGYAVGDSFNITTGGTNGKGRVTAISGSGVVTQVELYAAGSGYSVGTGRATTILNGSGNNGLTVSIASVGTVGRIVTVQNHNLVSGDTITFSGCTEGLWNASYQILAVDLVNAFDVVTTATASMVASATQAATTIVDSSKTWIVNEHVGKIVTLNTVGTSPTSQIRRITANTSNTLTVASITTAVNGTSRYVISQPEGFGGAQQYLVPSRSAYGYATSGSTTTLIDTTKNWINNQWAGYRFRINSGTGVGSEIAIISNTSNTLTYALQTFTPDITTQYKIMDSYGLLTTVTNVTNAVLTDTTKNWSANQWAGRRVRIISGAGAGQEATITSNTANALTITGVFSVAPDTTSNYVIYEVPAKGLGIDILWAYNTDDTLNKARFMYAPRGGGSNLLDRYNTTTNLWDLAINITPHTETFTTGTMYAYDGYNGIVIHRGDATTTLRTFRLNVNTLQVEAMGTPPYAHGTPSIGNRMAVIETVDGLNYLYIMRHGGQEMWRTLLF
jgi:hypothetical protein